MAFSNHTYTANGDIENFIVPFPFLDESHVFVMVNDRLTNPLGSEDDGDYKTKWTSDKTIEVSTVTRGYPPDAGDQIKLIRRTPVEEPYVKFPKGSALSSEDLNRNVEYLTYALQEAVDADERFIKIYLGVFSEEPTTDTHGEEIIVGALYLNRETGYLNFYIDGTWNVLEPVPSNLSNRVGAEAAKDFAQLARENAANYAEEAAERATQTASNAAGAALSLKIVTPATKAEAEAGVENNSFMTPLRTKEEAAHLHAITTKIHAELGVNNNVDMSALRTKQALDYQINALLPNHAWERIVRSTITFERFSWDFESFDSTKYDSYRFEVKDLRPKDDTDELFFIRIKEFGQSGFNDVTTKYKYSNKSQLISPAPSLNLQEAYHGASSSAVALTRTKVGTYTNGIYLNGTIDLHNPHTSTKTLITSEFMYTDDSGKDTVNETWALLYHSEPRVIGMQIRTATSKIKSGTISVFGKIKA